MTAILATLVTVTSGVVAGVLFAVALSVLPALRAMPAERYIYAHKLLGRNWDPTMPVIVLASTVLDIALAVLGPAGTTPLYVIGAVLLLFVSIVSHWGNVPINRQVKSIDPDSVPADWSDPRPLWQRFHTLRTSLAVVAVAVNAAALAIH